jgi:hypothetical protein
MRILDRDEMTRGCEYPICDFCKYYIDAGGGSVKRGWFAGHGHCAIDYEETTASDGCEEHFVCGMCQQNILEIWSCI